MSVPEFRVLAVFGTRPEAIKMAPVVRSLAMAEGIRVGVCVTAQHRQMLDQVLDLFQITPDFDLDLMAPGQDLNSLTSAVLKGMKGPLETFDPGLVLVHGDTTTTLGASLASYYARVPVGHVEAGLRTGNILSPWPEEVNRKVAGAIASVHFAPTRVARDNLLAENVVPESIHITGNTVIDALHQAAAKLKADPGLARSLEHRFELDPSKRTLLVTGHRRESFGDGFERICLALSALSQRPDLEIVYPVHLNPAVKGPVETRLGAIPNVRLIAPQEYLPFVYLMNRADVILTDSGGVQEEAPSLGKPVLVMRETTERPEAVAAGGVRLVGTDIDQIVSGVGKILDDLDAYQSTERSLNCYGDGRAADRITSVIQRFAAEHAPREITHENEQIGFSADAKTVRDYFSHRPGVYRSADSCDVRVAGHEGDRRRHAAGNRRLR
ncbi:non-hydrolyzing UDP-N-acetylglucosamine 2-epimerase [Amaricoccus tamworthensis]|uniref:non-hydrolyzing UDP-N-acetylglucosamine 2-epimerase n=1 Tax=Amaricoccus tamworthensis TaxID=57002 RepID=UPI003C7AF229